MIDKKDWVVAKKTFEDLTKSQENQIVNAELNLEIYKLLMPYIENKIKEFPEENKDPMPQEVKELVSELK